MVRIFIREKNKKNKKIEAALNRQSVTALNSIRVWKPICDGVL